MISGVDSLQIWYRNNSEMTTGESPYSGPKQGVIQSRKRGVCLVKHLGCHEVVMVFFDVIFDRVEMFLS